MPAELLTHLPLILIGLALLALLVWVLLRSGRKARVIDDGSAPAVGRDVLDEGAAPAARNQALIDAPRGTDAEAGPQDAPAPQAPLPATGSRDDLTRIKGLGPKIAALLGEFGITSFGQIAGWSPEDVERIDARLGRFSGRIIRDKWVEQAKLLAAGDEKGFAEQFGRNG
jgi:predicted flap endonuclease-1-like 5' DNA nuclease